MAREEINRRQITAEEVAEHIRYLEKHLKTLCGQEAVEFQQKIDGFKRQLQGMRVGDIKVFQRIPKRIK